MEEKNVVMGKVYGYEEIKEELERVKNWNKNKELVSNEKIMVPHNILLYGAPGNGKTLMIREFADSFDCPKYIIEASNASAGDEIKDVFARAAKDKEAIIVIDEIDLLVRDESRMTRLLQQKLDGFNKLGNNVMVLAAANRLRDIPDPLLRPGRFDKVIHVDGPDLKTRVKMIKDFCGELGMEITNPEDLEDFAKGFSESGATIKAVINDCYLRCGKKVSTDDIEVSLSRIVDNEYSQNYIQYKDERVAIHEAGHAVVSCINDLFVLKGMKFNKTGGSTIVKNSDELLDTINKRKTKIAIAMGGYLAEKAIYGHHDIGSVSDFDKVYTLSTKLVTLTCLYGIKDYESPYSTNDERVAPESKKTNNDKQVMKLIKSIERKVYKVIKRNKSLIKDIAKLFYEKGNITLQDIKDCGLEPRLKAVSKCKLYA